MMERVVNGKKVAGCMARRLRRLEGSLRSLISGLRPLKEIAARFKHYF